MQYNFPQINKLIKITIKNCEIDHKQNKLFRAATDQPELYLFCT